MKATVYQKRKRAIILSNFGIGSKIKDDNKSKDFEDEYIIIAIGITGIKVTNRGQWMRDKGHIKNKKGYLKIHIAINVKTKKILSMTVTDEHVHDSKPLPELVNESLNQTA